MAAAADSASAAAAGLDTGTAYLRGASLVGLDAAAPMKRAASQATRRAAITTKLVSEGEECSGHCGLGVLLLCTFSFDGVSVARRCGLRLRGGVILQAERR